MFPEFQRHRQPFVRSKLRPKRLRRFLFRHTGYIHRPDKYIVADCIFRDLLYITSKRKIDSSKYEGQPGYRRQGNHLKLLFTAFICLLAAVPIFFD